MNVGIEHLYSKTPQNRILRGVFRVATTVYNSCRQTITLSHKGVKVTVPLKAYLYNDGGWKIYLLGKLVPKGGALVDVGANLGQTLIEWKLSGASGQYVGFEPNYASASILSDIIKFNHYDDSFVAPVGLSNIEKLYLTKGMSTDQAASIVSDLRPGRPYDIQIIPVTALTILSTKLDFQK
ncbi:MAG: hypothetical protein WDN46_19235 [Methylocella sp.]